MLIDASDLDTSPCKWLVDGLIPEIGTGLWYGPSRVGKSLLINVELALAVANGVEFFGHETRQGTVVLCLGEGLYDAGVRLAARIARQDKENLAAVKAAEREFGPEFAAAVEEAQPLYTDAGIKVETHAFAVPVIARMGGMTANDRSFDMALASFKTIDNLALIVLDTVRKFSGGRSLTNDTQAGKFMLGMQQLAEELDCVVLGVNHETADGSKMRGSGVLFENSDFVAAFVPEKVTPGEPPAATVTCEKNKYGPEFDAFGYELEQDEMWLPVYDEDTGEPLTEDGEPVTRLTPVATVRQRTTVNGVMAPRVLPDIRQAQGKRKRTGVRPHLRIAG